MKITDKSARLAAIIRLVTENVISDQEEMLAALAKEGFVVTQATLSRDLKQLKIVKMPDGVGGYHYIYTQPKMHTRPQPIATASGVTSVDISGQMCVIKTLPGYASVTAAAIDDGEVPFVMGTIAGDDTVLLVLRAEAQEPEVRKSLKAILPDFDSRIFR